MSNRKPKKNQSNKETKLSEEEYVKTTKRWDRNEEFWKLKISEHRF